MGCLPQVPEVPSVRHSQHRPDARTAGRGGDVPRPTWPCAPRRVIGPGGATRSSATVSPPAVPSSARSDHAAPRRRPAGCRVVLVTRTEASFGEFRFEGIRHQAGLDRPGRPRGPVVTPRPCPLSCAERVSPNATTPPPLLATAPRVAGNVPRETAPGPPLLSGARAPSAIPARRGGRLAWPEQAIVRSTDHVGRRPESPSGAGALACRRPRRTRQSRTCSGATEAWIDRRDSVRRRPSRAGSPTSSGHPVPSSPCRWPSATTVPAAAAGGERSGMARECDLDSTTAP
jgi:hypothetical protein